MNNEQLAAFRSYVQTEMEKWQVHGLSIAVVQGNEVMMAEGFGYRDIEKKLAVTPDTLFAIGSCTKAFTALAAGQLMEEGKIDLDTPVINYLPTFKMHDPVATEQLTLRDMLCHRSGLPRHDLLLFNEKLSREDLIARLRYLEPSQPIRYKFQYNNLLITTAGYILGHMEGTPWEQVIQNYILGPLDMTESCMSIYDLKQSANHAVPYVEKEGCIVSTPYHNIDAFGPAGSINSNAKEMASWVLMNLNKGRYKDRTLVSEKYIAEMQTPLINSHSYVNQKEFLVSCYGLGWLIEPYRGHQMILHDGGIDGYSALTAFLPNNNIGIVVLTNKNSTPLPRMIAFNLFDRALGLDEVDWSGRFWEDYERAKSQEEEQQAQICESNHQQASRALLEYEGTYTHPGYGDIFITLRDEKLHMKLYAFESVLSCKDRSTFRLDLDIGMMVVPLNMTFQESSAGKIESLSMALNYEPGAKETIFIKQL